MKSKIILLNESNADFAIKEIARALKEEKTHQVIIEPHKKKRTLPQNSYYWSSGFLGYIAQETGHTAEELHQIFAEEFLVIETKQIAGREIKITKSTTKLSTQEFTDYMDKIRAKMADFYGLAIPLPYMDF